MDYQVFQLINQFAGKSGILDSIMIDLAKYGVLLMALPLLYMWFRRDDSAKKVALLSLLSMGIALLINQIIGHIYFRQRPFAVHDVTLLLSKSTDPSFPSDHSAFVFGIAWLLWMKDRKIGYFSLGIALLVGISRIFVGTHYPGDILGGAVIGFFTSLAIWYLKDKFDPITSFLVGIARKLKLA
ncbi:MAG: undecaprenyl-diphosphatase [Actinomycetota bacterium]|jgi:undecaprenyl-diphosphatase|nr:undecaprenyl-diphosphatase [Actinomycetota bacterium]MCL6093719.1 undecaprenyl-diphosphatase [Actinomycetota bacterium]MDA8167887.1 undecaprenyl-diphosphatase [Actinomycetota bacterium]